MPQFIDVHSGMSGATKQQLEDAHKKDQKIQDQEGVKFHKWWADPDSGKVFCLSDAPNKEAIKRVHKKAGHETDEIYEIRYSGE